MARKRALAWLLTCELAESTCAVIALLRLMRGIERGGLNEPRDRGRPLSHGKLGSPVAKADCILPRPQVN
jgi:hypothetical protein